MLAMRRALVPKSHCLRWLSESVGIVGMPNTGKSTLFNALTRTQLAHSANYPFATIEPASAHVPVPDPLLRQFAIASKSEKVIETQIEFVDIAGLVRGAHKGEGLGNQFLGTIRECDVIVHVVRCFNDLSIIHVEEDGVDPIRDLQTVRNELVLSDLASVEKRLQTGAKMMRARTIDADTAALDLVLRRCLALLEEGRDVDRAAFLGDHVDDPEERRLWGIAKSLNLLSSKPVVYVCNVDEAAAISGNDMSARVEECVRASGSPAICIVVCIRLEEEAAGFETTEAQAEYLELAGLQQTSLQKIIGAAHSLLSLHSFFTIGPKEARAWAIREGSTAVEAAGKIHSDFASSFVRAEVITAEDYPLFGGFPAARKAGKATQQGKDYIVQHGDVVLFSTASRK